MCTFLILVQAIVIGIFIGIGSGRNYRLYLRRASFLPRDLSFHRLDMMTTEFGLFTITDPIFFGIIIVIVIHVL